MMCSAAVKTREEIEKAFRKVKDAMQHGEAESAMYAEFQREGLEPVLVTEPYYDIVCKFIAEHHITRDPVSVALGVTWTPDEDSMYRDALRDNISVMVVTDSGDIVSVVVMSILKEGDMRFPIMHDASGAFAKALKFLTHKDEEINFFKRYSVTEGVHLMDGAVRASDAGRGIATLVGTFVKPWLLELGYKAFLTEATNPYSQRLCANFGFDQLAVLKYEEYRVNGEQVFRNMPARYTSMIIYGKKLQRLSPLSRL